MADGYFMHDSLWSALLAIGSLQDPIEIARRAVHVLDGNPLVQEVEFHLNGTSGTADIRISGGRPRGASPVDEATRTIIPLKYGNLVLGSVVARVTENIDRQERVMIVAFLQAVAHHLFHRYLLSVTSEIELDLTDALHERVLALEDSNRRLKHEIGDRRTAEQRVVEELREKTAAVQEIHHRVKNNLQVILSLIAVARQTADGADTDTVLGRIADRIQVMAAAYDEVLHSPTVGRVAVDRLFSRLTHELSQQGIARIRLTAPPSSRTIGADIAVPLALLIREALTVSVPGGCDVPVTSRIGDDILEIEMVVGPGPEESVSRRAGRDGVLDAMLYALDATLAESGVDRSRSFVVAVPLESPVATDRRPDIVVV